MENLDELCKTCATIDLFSLFSGDRYYVGSTYDRNARIHLSTLAQVVANKRCPLCRLLQHDFQKTFFEGYSLNIAEPPLDLFKIRVSVRPTRVDYYEDLKYHDDNAKEKLGTILLTYLSPLDGISPEHYELIKTWSHGNGIQLLSPDHVDSARPLMNGYRATNINRSLDLLRHWMNTCVESHSLQHGGRICHRMEISPSIAVDYIRVIDIENRSVVEKNPKDIDYAALSYRWNSTSAPDEGHGNRLSSQGDEKPIESTMKPTISEAPKVIEDALLVCQRIGVPYLWVDRYCIDQQDSAYFLAEIKAMGFRYHDAKIVLIAGRDQASNEEENAGLLPAKKTSSSRDAQRTETVQGRKYITALPSIMHQILSTRWSKRAWTMQEGQLATRCAFFGKYDISFMCGLGHWRESHHSGQYAHEAEFYDIDTRSQGYYFLSWQSWLKSKVWKFEDYVRLVVLYSTRQFSFEKDILNAFSGCLQIITEIKKVHFLRGIPFMDFHYALLWSGERNEKQREGFPSWSWTGWYMSQLWYDVYPSPSSTCSLEVDGYGHLRTVGPSEEETEIEGDYISLLERPHLANRCLQRFANISCSDFRANHTIIIESEVAHFDIDLVAVSNDPDEICPPGILKLPKTFDSASHEDVSSLDPVAEYLLPDKRLRLRDDLDNVHIDHGREWHEHWPIFRIKLPRFLRGKTLAWLLNEGLWLIKILELEVVAGDPFLRPFHLVLCLGIDRRSKTAKRFGTFSIPKKYWSQARPVHGSIVMG